MSITTSPLPVITSIVKWLRPFDRLEQCREFSLPKLFAPPEGSGFIDPTCQGRRRLRWMISKNIDGRTSTGLVKSEQVALIVAIQEDSEIADRPRCFAMASVGQVARTLASASP